MDPALLPSQVPAACTAITAGPLPACPAADGAFTTTIAQPCSPASPVPTPAVAQTPLSDVLQAWPRSAQWATALLLGVAVALVAVYSLGHLRSGSRPMELARGTVLSYRVDLNRAGRAELLQLPGIGPSMVQHIEEYRVANGDFRSVEDLTRIKGIGPATLERLRPWVVVENKGDIGAPVRPERAAAKREAAVSKSKKAAALTARIDINSASIEELRKLPGIGPKKSQAIVEAREKGRFRTVDELRGRVPGIGPKTLERLRPYITVQGEPPRIAIAE